MPPTTRATAVSNVSTSKIFRTLTPSDSEEYTDELKALYCLAPGDVALEDYDGNQTTFVVVAGQILYLRPKKVLATGTTATVVGLFT
jgi:hypothetical protein